MPRYDDLLDAVSRFHSALVAAVQARMAGHEHRALRAAMLAAAELVLAGMAETPSDDDWKLVRLYQDVAAAFLDTEHGNLPVLFTPLSYGSGNRPMTVAEVSYRAWSARASLALVHAGRDRGDADRTVAEATAWVDDDPECAARLGGALTPKAVRNMRLAVERNDPDNRIAQFARGIPSLADAGRTAARQADWFVAQIASPTGQAFLSR
jgi:hypothetical protein